jgi:hypothetical protein
MTLRILKRSDCQYFVTVKYFRGRDWLKPLDIKSYEIDAITPEPESTEQLKLLQQVLHDYSDLFAEQIGTVLDFEVSRKLQPGVQPVYAKVRPVPYALLTSVDQEINRLEEDGIIERVEYSGDDNC